MEENVIYLDNRLVIDDGILAEYIPSEEHDKYKKAPGDARRFNMLEQMLKKRSSDTYKVECILGSLYEIIKADRAGDFTIEVVEELLGDVENIIQSISTEKKVYGEVLTPLSLVNEMLDTLPKEVWSDPNKKWLDPANGTGAFMMVVYYRLIKGLEEVIPDINQRRKHILENMLYIGELQNETSIIFLSMVDFYDDVRVNIFSGDTLSKEFDEHVKNVWKVDKFDIVVMNPPYQESIEGNKRSRPLYNLFIDKMLGLSSLVLTINPSRWMSGGFGLTNFRDRILSLKNIRSIKHFDENVFGDGVDIMGGVSYYLFDNDFVGLPMFNGIEMVMDKYDIVVDNKYHSILDKILDNNQIFLSDICKSQSYYGFPGNESLFTRERIGENDVKVYVSKNKGGSMYVNRDYIRDSHKINGYKVFTPSANGRSKFFGNKIIGYPNEVASKTYMVLLTNTEDEAKSLISYMNTDFCNFFLSLRKSTQNMKPDTLKWIPIVPFDREWTDEKLFEYFKLEKKDIDLIL